MRRFPESRGAKQNKTLIFRKVHRRALPHRLQPGHARGQRVEQEDPEVRVGRHHPVRRVHHHQVLILSK